MNKIRAFLTILAIATLIAGMWELGTEQAIAKPNFCHDVCNCNGGHDYCGSLPNPRCQDNATPPQIVDCCIWCTSLESD